MDYFYNSYLQYTLRVIIALILIIILVVVIILFRILFFSKKQAATVIWNNIPILSSNFYQKRFSKVLRLQ